VQVDRRLTYLIVMAMCGGCGVSSKPVRLQGEVSFAGRPIEKGKIDFVPADGTPGGAISAAILAGRYEVPPQTGLLPTGVYTARVIGLRRTGKTEPNRIERGGPPIEVEENFIPATCNVNSTLKVRVADLPDKNKVDFHIGNTLAVTPH
jgi:hypothetical protein